MSRYSPMLNNIGLALSFVSLATTLFFIGNKAGWW